MKKAKKKAAPVNGDAKEYKALLVAAQGVLKGVPDSAVTMSDKYRGLGKGNTKIAITATANRLSKLAEAVAAVS